ncbi:MAG: NAD-dependent DNA ligase LigA [Euzebya sp.]
MPDRAPKSIRDRHDELARTIREARYHYYVLSQQVIPDVEFDDLFRELEELEADHPDLVTPDSPTQQVGAPTSDAFPPFQHPSRMESLDNVFSRETLWEWMDRAERRVGGVTGWMCEPKIDGTAVNLIYHQGVLSVAATRGSGQEGDTVTAQIATIADVPYRLSASETPELLEVRGEVYIPLEEFSRMNASRIDTGLEAFSNPRNTASGALRQKDPRDVAQRPLHFWVHGFGICRGMDFARQSDLLGWARAAGLPTPELSRAVTEREEVWEYVTDLVQLRHDLAYEVDGVVVKIDDRSQQLEAGSTAKAPRWAIAYKMAPVEASTVLESIEINVGRTGKVTPFAVLQPVQVGGVTIERATLHNETQIHKKDVRVGDTVMVRRAGEVIPEVIGPVRDKRPAGTAQWSMPARCPSCGEELARPEGEAHHFCENVDCPDRLFESVVHLAGRSALDIDGLGHKSVALFIELGFITNLADVFRLDREQLSGLSGWGDKSIDNLTQAIDRARQRPLQRLLVALNIRHLGPVVATQLARSLGHLDQIMSADPDALADIDGIGPIVAHSVASWAANERNQALVAEFGSLGVRMDADRVPAASEAGTPGPLDGMSVVITGTIPEWSRSDLKAALEERGAKVRSAVSGSTDALVVGADPGGKLADAERLEVKIVGPEELDGFLDGV